MSRLAVVAVLSSVFTLGCPDPEPEDATFGDGGPGTEDAGGVNPDGGVPTGNCEQDHIVIAGWIDAHRQAHAGGCTQDADCVLVDSSIDCSQYCQVAVRASSSSQFKAGLDAYGALVCPHVACVASGLCPSFDEAICHQGTCRRGYADGGLAP